MVGTSLFRDTFLLALGVSRMKVPFYYHRHRRDILEGTFSNPECVLIGVFVSFVT